MRIIIGGDFAADDLKNDVVLYGASLRKLKTLPSGTWAGDNANRSLGGFLLGKELGPPEPSPSVDRDDRPATIGDQL